MKNLTMCCVLVVLAMPAVSLAAGDQQNRMKHCNEAAAGKSGDARKAFMSSCLKKAE
jgi:hypothetical protein